jgi:hypothetical protein
VIYNAQVLPVTLALILVFLSHKKKSV